MSSPSAGLLTKGRLESFSDGVFAIAITLLALEFQLPGYAKGDVQQWRALIGLWPEYLVFFASFATIGIMWLNHHAMFARVRRITHGIVVSNLFLLLSIVFLPFSTVVLDKYAVSRPAIVFYGLTLIATAAGYNILYQQIVAAHPSARRPLTTWNIVGLTLYPAATVVAYFTPLVGVALFAGLAIFYLLPQNVRAAAIEP